MKHNTDSIREYVTHELDQFKNEEYKFVPDAFVYAFGPYMTMNPGFEYECDDIAKYNIPMLDMLHASYLIRVISKGVSYKEAYEIIKDFIIKVDMNYQDPILKDHKDKLIEFANKYSNRLKEEKDTNNYLESFITNSAPIVPYEGHMIQKQEIDPMYVTKVNIDYNIDEEYDKENELNSLLLNNIEYILMYNDLVTSLIDLNYPNSLNLSELDHLMIHNDYVPDDVKRYYMIATTLYFKIQKSTLNEYINFFKLASNFSTSQSYESFESMINNVADIINVDISEESYNDPDMNQKVNELLDSVLPVRNNNIDKEYDRYDFNRLDSFFAIGRFAVFTPYANSFFTQVNKKYKILNYNNGTDPNKIYFELDNDSVVCPFLDIRDERIKVAVLDKGTNDIYVIHDLREEFE